VATVDRIRTEPAGPALAAAVAHYLATLDHPETAATRRVYAGTLAAMCATLGAERPVADLAERVVAEQLAAWFSGRWGARASATFNRNLDTLRAALGYWHEQGWLDSAADPTRNSQPTPPRPRTGPHQGAGPRSDRGAVWA
jgi:hypothetical protein